MVPQTIILIGRSGCGKGTQAALFRNRLDRIDKQKQPILYVETGQYFREFIREGTFSSTLSKVINEKGERQPNFLACWMWSKVLIEELTEGMHLIFDGAPRARAEAEILTTALRFYKRETPVVIHINVSRLWSEEKLLKRGRSDDLTIEKIDKRLDWFDKDVIPALNYFKSDPFYKFVEVDGEQSIEKVHADIVAAYEYSH
ncbi:MAG: nucleoside monophosphate kinase [Patescibacteria group bacterium]